MGGYLFNLSLYSTLLVLNHTSRTYVNEDALFRTLLCSCIHHLKNCDARQCCSLSIAAGGHNSMKQRDKANL